jgi:FtsP/CotA-like multicopper oxidase with cupredoxin domain
MDPKDRKNLHSKFRENAPDSVLTNRQKVAARQGSVAIILFICVAHILSLYASAEVCPRPAAGSAVTSPYEIRSRNGVLRVSLSLRRSINSSGEVRYCYVDGTGNENPTLRVKPGDLLVLRLRNETADETPPQRSDSAKKALCDLSKLPAMDMQANSTNLHFHGLTIPPVRHQDEVLKTSIPADSHAFEYRIRIPAAQPPGLYWYHPHPHGHSEEQVLGGASGALIVDGVEQFEHALAGLPERLFVVRDQARVSTEISPTNPKPPSRDISVNFVPVPYPEYPTAVIQAKPSQREFWRVLNASADTFLDLHLLTNGNLQTIRLISIDGYPLDYGASDKASKQHWTQSVPIPPGGRAEFLFDVPSKGVTQLLTSGVDTVPPQSEDDDLNTAAEIINGKPYIDDDDYTPPRWILKITPSTTAIEPPSLAKDRTRLKRLPLPDLANAQPVRERRFYFSEKIQDPKNPRASTLFFITEEGKDPAVFDPNAPPNVTVTQGDVEDWVIENRSQEIHSFHIHQTHFLVLERDGNPAEENYLRDSVTLPYWDGVSKYPSVKLRMDFRAPGIVGTFPYHCHILQHEDGGMMGTIRVLSADNKRTEKAADSSVQGTHPR